MGRSKITITALALAACLALAGCGKENTVKEEANSMSEKAASAEANHINEGDDTPIEVTAYSRYTGPNADIFLKEGDKVAVISPSALPTREQADAAIEGLKTWGYVPVEGKYVCKEDRTLEMCVEDLTWALTDPEIKGIFCVRGGYAACEVIEAMDRSLIASAKKPIIGYSDISACHSAWNAAGLPSIHASMSAAFIDLPEKCVEVQKRMMQGEIPAYKCGGSRYDNKGTAEGVLIGGNLTVLTNVINTEYDSTGINEPYILFLEDIGSDFLNAHCSLTVLKNLGILDNAAGIILGEWTDFDLESDDYDGSSRGGRFTSAADMIYRQFLKDLDIPIAYDFPAGHGEVNYPLLMGAKVRLDVGEDEYTLEWLDVE